MMFTVEEQLVWERAVKVEVIEGFDAAWMLFKLFGVKVKPEQFAT